MGLPSANQELLRQLISPALSVEQRCRLIQRLSEQGDLELLPYLLAWLGSGYESVLAQACQRLLQPLAPHQLVPVDGMLRQWYPGDGWSKLDQSCLLRASRLPQGRWLTAAISCHGNGYLRELALRQLANTAAEGWEPAFYLLRVHDWVPQVRDAARQALLKFPLWSADHVGLLPMLDRLRLAQRGDPARFVDQLEPHLQPLLEGALAHPDWHVRRGALRPALSYRDPQAVLRAAWLDPHIAVVQRALQLSRPLDLPDPFWRPWLSSPRAAVRREAYQRLAQQLSAEEWRPALFDPCPALQALARYQLRHLDLAQIHRQALQVGPVSVGLIRGLAALGGPPDADLLEPLWQHPRSKIVRQVMAACARLDGQRTLTRFMEHLRDGRHGVAHQAARALQPYAGRLLPGLLEIIHDPQLPVHSRGFALVLAERADKWGALPSLLQLSDSQPPLSDTARACLKRWLARLNHRQLLPTPQQWENCWQALAASSLTGPGRNQLEQVLRMVPRR